MISLSFHGAMVKQAGEGLAGKPASLCQLFLLGTPALIRSHKS